MARIKNRNSRAGEKSGAELAKTPRPAESMASFFSREDVRRLQDIQKANPYGSAKHRQAFDQIKELAARVGADQFIGSY